MHLWGKEEENIISVCERGAYIEVTELFAFTDDGTDYAPIDGKTDALIHFSVKVFRREAVSITEENGVCIVNVDLGGMLEKGEWGMVSFHHGTFKEHCKKVDRAKKLYREREKAEGRFLILNVEIPRKTKIAEYWRENDRKYKRKITRNGVELIPVWK